jgi:hypothetical protein
MRGFPDIKRLRRKHGAIVIDEGNRKRIILIDTAVLCAPEQSETEGDKRK